MWRCLGLAETASGCLRGKCWRDDSRKGRWSQTVKGWKASAFFLLVGRAGRLQSFLSSEFIPDAGFRRVLWLSCPVCDVLLSREKLRKRSLGEG